MRGTRVLTVTGTRTPTPRTPLALMTVAELCVKAAMVHTHAPGFAQPLLTVLPSQCITGSRVISLWPPRHHLLRLFLSPGTGDRPFRLPRHGQFPQYLVRRLTSHYSHTDSINGYSFTDLHSPFEEVKLQVIAKH